MHERDVEPRRRLRRALLGAAVITALAVGVAACGDDEGDTDTGPDETATAQFCSSLEDFSQAVAQGESLTVDSSQTEIQDANEALGGATDELGLAAQGAEIDVSALSDASAAAGPAIEALIQDPSAETLEALQAALEPVAEAASSLEGENCAGVDTSTG